MIREKELVKIGQFTKPHGINGEIVLLTDYDLSEISGDPFVVCEMDGIQVPFFIDSYRQKGAAASLVKLERLDSEKQVKILAGKTVYIPANQLPQPDKENIRREQLSGFAVTDEKYGPIGQVSDIDNSTLNILLRINRQGHEMLVPAALITAIDPEQNKITVALPEGFLDI